MPLRSSTNNNSNSNNSSNNNNNSKTMQPSISVTDLQSVQLRKTTSLPLKTPLSPEPSFAATKDDVIAELKKGVDISGIKKLRHEKAREEEMNGKLEKEEINRQFSAVNFVDQIPDTDNAGNRIPEWKRQMLARKAADRAKREAEEQRQAEAEQKRLQSIPMWKRQLLMRKEEENKRSNMYVPKIEDVKKIKVTTAEEEKKEQEKKAEEEKREEEKRREEEEKKRMEEEEDVPVNPWRTNLRKTNSKLNLLE